MTILRHDGYIATIEIDDDGDGFFGEVINVPGAITFYGRDLAELKAELARSVEVYETLCAQQGIKPRKLSGRFMIRMTPDQHAKVQAAATLAGKSINGWAVATLARIAGEALEWPAHAAPHGPAISDRGMERENHGMGENDP